MSDSSASGSAELRRTAERLIGTDLDGRYRIDELIGAGGMGAVFRGHHKFMDQAVAIKVLRPTLASDPSAARRFVREARGTLKVDSEHAVKVLDFAITDDGLLYMVLELLEGRTVGAELTDDGPMAPRRAVRVARQVCDALAAAHRVGFIHRDLKPDNVMLVRRAGDPDFAKVLDFGLAKVMEGAGEHALSMAALTQGGLVFGTPDYMAPEQALGQALDARCDLYALGATLFEMLTGRPPFVAASPLEVLAAHVRELPPRLRTVRAELAIPDQLEQLVASCLAKPVERRPTSAVELGVALQAIEAQLAGGRRSALAETMPVPALRADVVATRPLATGPGQAADRGESGGLGLGESAAATTRGASAGFSADELPRRRSRAPMIIVGAAVLAAAALVAIATRPRARPTPALVVAAAGAPPALPVDAGVLDAPARDAGRPAVDAAPREPTAGRAAAAAAAAAERLAAHLSAAESAHRSGNRLRQLAEADAALTLAPGNRRARFLIGDALVAAGDLAQGCRFLRRAGAGVATARADAAGCR